MQLTFSLKNCVLLQLTHEEYAEMLQIIANYGVRVLDSANQVQDRSVMLDLKQWTLFVPPGAMIIQYNHYQGRTITFEELEWVLDQKGQIIEPIVQ
jgi:hypothetical protein